MKKYLIILLAHFAYADMDKVCLIYFPESWVSDLEIQAKMVKKKCKKTMC